jgi:predicted esterase YcpF (UPF0227 family)
MTKIIYINGFAGGGPSPKVDALEKAFPGDVIVPYTPARADEAYRKLYHEIGKVDPDEELIFVGTSLGAFWAALFSSHFRCSALLLNPALDPATTLQKYIGQVVDGRKWSLQDCIAYSSTKLKLNDGIPRIVLCEKGDEVISHKDVEAQLQLDKYYHAHLKVLEGGSHRFENYPEMVEAIKQLLYQVG